MSVCDQPGQKRRVAILRVTPELLIAALRLPADTTIHEIRYAHDGLYGTIEIQIEHPLLKEVPEAEWIPSVDAQLQMDPNGRTRFTGWLPSSREMKDGYS